MTTLPVQPIGRVEGLDALLPQSAATGAAPTGGANAFGQLLMNGVDSVNQKVVDAEKLSAQFAVDDSVPLHQVTFALQQARLSLEFMLQVRTRLVEAYQQFASMQL
ncbi:MAG TPA: flagellar hook-basal body complex protein FliE [Caulobacteraceae bacterium]|jgi:flagellar hook-basal body complex protein FliE